MILRRFIAVCMTALGACALVGCSVPLTGGVGLRVEDGRVQALVQMCPDVTASEATLAPSGPNFFWEERTWAFSAAEFTTVDLGSLDEFLDFVGDRPMEVSSNSSEGISSRVTFVSADVRNLQDGEILSDRSEIFDMIGFENTSCPGG